MTARISLQMSDEAIVAECRQEMDAARAIPGGGAFLKLEPFAEQRLMRLIIKQSDRIKALEASED